MELIQRNEIHSCVPLTNCRCLPGLRKYRQISASQPRDVSRLKRIRDGMSLKICEEKLSALYTSKIRRRRLSKTCGDIFISGRDGFLFGRGPPSHVIPFTDASPLCGLSGNERMMLLLAVTFQFLIIALTVFEN